MGRTLFVNIESGGRIRGEVMIEGAGSTISAYSVLQTLADFSIHSESLEEFLGYVKGWGEYDPCVTLFACDKEPEEIGESFFPSAEISLDRETVRNCACRRLGRDIYGAVRSVIMGDAGDENIVWRECLFLGKEIPYEKIPDAMDEAAEMLRHPEWIYKDGKGEILKAVRHRKS